MMVRAVLALTFSLVLLAPVTAAADVDDECISANEKAIELRKQGKLLEARAETAKCAIDTCPADVQRVCAKRAEQITSVLPSIVFEVRDESGADVGGVSVVVDGVAVNQGTATALSLNPGEHAFVFESASRGQRIERTFVLREGEQQRRERIVMTTPGRPPSAVPRPESGPAPMPDVANGGTNTGADFGTQRTIGLILGGVGAAGLVMGGVFGLVAKSKWDDAKTQCGEGCGPDDPAQGTKRSAEGSATVATIAMVGGGVLLAGGAALFFLAPPRSTTGAGTIRFKPLVGARGVFLTAGGTW